MIVVAQTTLPGFFPVQCCLEPLGQHCTGVFLCNIVFGVFQTTLHRDLTCAMLSQRQHWTKFLLVHCCLEPQGQHCTWFYSMQYCPKIIISLGNIQLEKPSPEDTAWEKILFNVVLMLFGQHYIGKNPVQWFSRGSQHCIGISSIRCCLNRSETTFHKKITCVMLFQSTQLCFHEK